MTYKDIPGYCDFHAFYKEVFEQLPDGAHIAEVGVYLGHSVAFMATMAKEAGKAITIYAVDTFEGSKEHRKRDFCGEFIANMSACGVDMYIRPIIGESALTPQYIRRQFDFVFIDAAHDYESVKADIQAWMPKVKEGGILAGHDYCEAWPGVKKVVDELLPNRQLNKSVWWIRM